MILYKKWGTESKLWDIKSKLWLRISEFRFFEYFYFITPTCLFLVEMGFHTSCLNMKNKTTLIETVWLSRSCLSQGEELQLVREALRSLRDSFSGHDPQHHTLDTLEQGVSSLMDRLHSLDTQRRQDRGVHTLSHTHTLFQSKYK